MNGKINDNENSFLKINEKDLFLFTGKKNMSPFIKLYGNRDYVEHFEEYIRWTKANNSEKLMERYVIEDYNLTQNTLLKTEQLYKKNIYYQPSVVVYTLDLKKIPSEKELNKTKENLLNIIQFTLDSNNNKGKFVLLLSCTLLDDESQMKIKKCFDYIINKIIQKFNEEKRERIKVIDYYEKTKLIDKTKIITTDNCLNEKGHLLFGKILAKELYGVAQKFPDEGIKQDLLVEKETKNRTQLSYHKNMIKLKDFEPKIEWLFIGDSLSHGALWTYGYKSYIELFKNYINETLSRKKDVFINTAVSGSTVSSTLARIKYRFDLYSPDIVHIMLGTNDVKGCSPSEYKDNLENLIKYINHSNKSIILLSTIIPAVHNVKAIIQFNKIIKELSDEYSNVILIDQYNLFNQILNNEPKLWEAKYQFYSDIPSLHMGPNGHLFAFRNLIKHLKIMDYTSELLNYYYIHSSEDKLKIEEAFEKLNE